MSKLKNIEQKRKMLKIQSEFIKVGITTFPKKFIAKQCPFKDVLNATTWMNSAQNVWHLRNSDSDIINAFELSLEDARTTIKNIEVI